MKYNLLFFLLLLIPTITYAYDDSILNCEQFEGDWWNPLDWVEDTNKLLLLECDSIMLEEISDRSKKIKILNLYNQDINTFDYEFVNKWNNDIEIDLSLDVQDIIKNNQTLIKNAFFLFSTLEPSVNLKDTINRYVIPFNPNLNVDYGYEVFMYADIINLDYPDVTGNGYCSEVYTLKKNESSFDLFTDKIKSIGTNLGKDINLTLDEQGSHSIDGLYSINVEIFADYTKWSAYCAKTNDNGFCVKKYYECDGYAKDRTFSDQIILTDYKEVVIEQVVLKISQVNITGFNEKITASVFIEGVDSLQRYDLNGYYKKTNFFSNLNYLYEPYNYIELEALENDNILYQSSAIKKDNEMFTFPLLRGIKNITFEYSGFYFNNTIITNLSYKNFTYPDLFFDSLYYSNGDNVTIYPYIKRENFKCKNCTIVSGDNVKIQYGDINVLVSANSDTSESKVSFIYDESIDCISVYYPGDENHYSSQRCFKITKLPVILEITIYMFYAYICFSFVFLGIRYQISRRKK